MRPDTSTSSPARSVRTDSASTGRVRDFAIGITFQGFTNGPRAAASHAGERGAGRTPGGCTSRPAAGGRFQMKVAILTGGGDCPGLNAVIRAVVRRGEQHEFDLVGVRDGWRGLIENNHF